jgi:hypothetical protein
VRYRIQISEQAATLLAQQSLLDSLQSELTTLRELVESYEKSIREYDFTIQSLEEHISQKEGENITLKNDNTTLRNIIVQTKHAPEPLKVESYYVDNLDRLNQFISSKVAEVSKMARNHKICEKEGKEVLRVVGEVGKYGDLVRKVLGHGLLWNLEGQVRGRIAVMRHIIALFLYQYVFGGFAFGMDDPNLRNIEDQMVEMGIPLVPLSCY